MKICYDLCGQFNTILIAFRTQTWSMEVLLAGCLFLYVILIKHFWYFIVIGKLQAEISELSVLQGFYSLMIIKTVRCPYYRGVRFIENFIGVNPTQTVGATKSVRLMEVYWLYTVLVFIWGMIVFFKIYPMSVYLNHDSIFQNITRVRLFGAW